MIRTRAQGILIAGFWLVLAAWQSARSFARCEVSTGVSMFFWGVHMVLLLAPLVAVVALTRTQSESGPDCRIAAALLTYPPMVIAMRLVEICAM